MVDSRTAIKRLALAFVLLLAVGLQVAAAAQKSFWEDEAETATVSRGAPAQVIAAIQRVHPPLYFLSVSLWGRLFGYEELGLRSLSILCVALTLLLTYRFASQAFGQRAAFIAALLLAISPFTLTYGHNARYYALSALLSVAAVFALYTYRRAGRKRYLAAYVAASAALLYTVYVSFAVVLACGLWWLVCMWTDSRKYAAAPGARLAGILKNDLAPWLAAHITIALAFTPWLVVLFRSASALVRVPAVAGWALDVAKRVMYLAGIFSIGETISPLQPLAWAGIAAVLAGSIALAVAAARRKRASPRAGRVFSDAGAGPIGLLVALVFVSAGISIVVDVITSYPQPSLQNLPHRDFFVYPFFLLCLACGIASLRLRWTAALTGVLLVVYGYGIFNYYTDQQFIRPTMAVPWNAIMQMIRAQGRPDAVVICNQADTVCPYYAARYGFTPRAPAAWSKGTSQPPAEVWWFQSNLGGSVYNTSQEQAALRQVETRYSTRAAFNYAAHDPSIRWLKSTLLGQEDYAYRVNLFRFDDPIALSR